MDADKTITHCDAERVVDDGSYKSLPNAILEQMRNACLNVQGINQINVDRVRRKGDIISKELASREERKREQAGLVSLSAGSETDPSDLCGIIPSETSWSETKLV